MSLIWPSHVTQTPSAVARVGRLAHYASFIPAAYLAWLTWDELHVPENLRIDHQTASMMVLLIFGTLLAGRGLRWVFAGE